jgi:hypothetical protein
MTAKSKRKEKTKNNNRYDTPIIDEILKKPKEKVLARGWGITTKDMLIHGSYLGSTMPVIFSSKKDAKRQLFLPKIQRVVRVKVVEAEE